MTTEQRRVNSYGDPPLATRKQRLPGVCGLLGLGCRFFGCSCRSSVPARWSRPCRTWFWRLIGTTEGAAPSGFPLFRARGPVSGSRP